MLDGYCDKSLKLIQSQLANTNVNYKVIILDENQGITKALNIGCENVNFRYLARCDNVDPIIKTT